MTTSYDLPNNLPEISFTAGTAQSLEFITYESDGITLVDVTSIKWRLCKYGEFGTTILEKEKALIWD